MAVIIDGKKISAGILAQVSVDINAFKNMHGITPGLAVVLVGEDPASQVYVRNKVSRATEVGMHSFEHRLSENVSQVVLNDLIQELNGNPDVHGILVQLPLPAHLNEDEIVNAIDPNKDVDGFHSSNVAALASGAPRLVPCTPKGCMIMLEQTLGDLSGKHAVVIGRSNIVGKPMAALLLQAHCSVTTVHSRSRDIAALCRHADIVIAAVGSPNLVKSEWIKPGATVIDVGINAITIEGVRKLVGDVDFADVGTVAGAITPVPGGVGPMTIANLLQNTMTAAHLQRAS
ncbi:MAG: bifunctional methylenetetrahydrofolate dehydrogenase/methenyltetrahydrofolate cyclohydrolase FolD [Psychromonas sp.]